MFIGYKLHSSHINYHNSHINLHSSPFGSLACLSIPTELLRQQPSPFPPPFL